MAWMGAHLPFRNRRHKGIDPFWDKPVTVLPTRMAICLGWADHSNGHIVTKPPRALSPLPRFFTLDIHTSLFFMILCFLFKMCFAILLLSPQRSFPYRPNSLFLYPQQHMVPDPQQYTNILLYSTPTSIPQHLFSK